MENTRKKTYGTCQNKKVYNIKIIPVPKGKGRKNIQNNNGQDFSKLT